MTPASKETASKNPVPNKSDENSSLIGVNSQMSRLMQLK
jgi:hypothetical protein